MAFMNTSCNKPVLGVYAYTFLNAVEKHIYRQVAGIQSFEVVAFYKERLNADIFPMEQECGINPKRMPLHPQKLWHKYIGRQPSFVYRGYKDRMLAGLEEHKVDLLHIYFGHNAIQALPLIEDLQLPFVVSFHGKDASAFFNEPQYAAQMPRVFQKATLVFVRSNIMGQALVARGCPPEKIRVTYAGISLRQFVYHPRILPIGKEPVRFIQSCRLIPKKGLDTLIEAFHQVQQQSPNCSLEIIGAGPMEKALKQQIQQLGLQDKVFLRGYLETPALIDALQASHIFVHPSQTDPDGDQEGIPNAILEAMAMGLPVITTDHAGIPELITNGQNGVMVPERDVTALANAMLAMMRRPETWEPMSRVARKLVADRHDIHQQIRRLESYYYEALRIHLNAELMTGHTLGSVMPTKDPLPL